MWAGRPRLRPRLRPRPPGPGRLARRTVPTVQRPRRGRGRTHRRRPSSVRVVPTSLHQPRPAALREVRRQRRLPPAPTPRGEARAHPPPSLRRCRSGGWYSWVGGNGTRPSRHRPATLPAPRPGPLSPVRVYAPSAGAAPAPPTRRLSPVAPTQWWGAYRAAGPSAPLGVLVRFASASGGDVGLRSSGLHPRGASGPDGPTGRPCRPRRQLCPQCSCGSPGGSGPSARPPPRPGCSEAAPPGRGRSAPTPSK